MVIYEFVRPDGSQGLDYSVPEGAKIVEKFAADSEVKLVKLIQFSEGRLKALAERALQEQFPPPDVSTIPRSFFGRMRWLFTGK